MSEMGKTRRTLRITQLYIPFRSAFRDDDDVDDNHTDMDDWARKANAIADDDPSESLSLQTTICMAHLL